MNSHVAILYSPRGEGKILRTYHFILPKFHFILPKFYFFPTWGSFCPSLGIFSSQRGWEIFVPSVWDDLSGLFVIL